MRKVVLFLLTALFSVLAGAIGSAVFGIEPDIAIGGSLLTSMVAMPIVGSAMPSGILMAAPVFKSAYESELLKSLKTVSNGFLARIPDKSELLEANTIDYTKIGAKPNVLIDNTVYPIPGGQRTDEGLRVNLRKLTTEKTIITRDEIHNLPYDKKSSVIEQHKEALAEKYNKLALYSFCPTASAATMPVLSTTGENDGTGRKRLTKGDLLKFRTALNNLGIGQCDLVLCDEHVEDISLWSDPFANNYHVVASGLILPLYGFNMIQNQGYAPVFNAGTKAAFEAAAAVGDVNASVAYLPNRMFRAYGDLEMFFTEANASYHQDEANFDAYFIAAPKDSEGRGAIISGLV
jgi:hypothetical protein